MEKEFTAEYFEMLAESRFTTKYHYKILMLLLTGEYTQIELAHKLKTSRQNVHRCVNELREHGYVAVGREEGRYKFLKAITSAEAIRSVEKRLYENKNETERNE